MSSRGGMRALNTSTSVPVGQAISTREPDAAAAMAHCTRTSVLPVPGPPVTKRFRESGLTLASS
eukprot:11427680-Heterocapsa_arctica.AAC.1